MNSNFDNVSVLWEDATPATIPWLKFGSLTRDFSGKYYFQPDVNNTGADRTLDVKQAHANPMLTITDATTINPTTNDATLNVTGTSATAPASIKFDTNSDWAFYEDNTGIANASAAGSVFSISSGSPTLNTTYNSGGLPLSPVSQSLNLYAGLATFFRTK